jgi:outer membrane protein
MIQKALLAANALLLLAVGVLFYFHFTGKTPQGPSAGSSKLDPAAIEKARKQGQLIAYVNVDTLEEQYILFKEKKASLEKRQQAIESTLQAKAQAFQREVAAFQEKAPTMTQSEGEAAQESLYKKQAELEEMRDRFAKSFMAEQEDFNQQLNNSLDSFLLEYNADKRFTYILSYTKGGSILYTDPAFDITRDVVEGMNAKLPKK